MAIWPKIVLPKTALKTALRRSPMDARLDKRYMDAAIRLGRWHLARTGTNPSVATILVNDLGNGPIIVGSGITGIGGRPHAEAGALAEAGDRAKGATAYVTLEPCAHHGRTPPCANALVNAGITRLVCALTDPDDRVSGAGFEILEAANIEISQNCSTHAAKTVLGAYLARSVNKRAQVTLKLAVSKDGKIGKKDEPNFAITGAQARAQSHILRATHDAIIIGIGTALADDPTLTCRLPGMETRSPIRIVLDTGGQLPLDCKLVHTINQAPLYVATAYPQSDNAKALAAKGVNIVSCDLYKGRIALPELMEDLAAIGITNALVEGGAEIARSFLDDDLVRSIALFESDLIVGHNGIMSPIEKDNLPDGFAINRQYHFGGDRLFEIEQS